MRAFRVQSSSSIIQACQRPYTDNKQWIGRNTRPKHTSLKTRLKLGCFFFHSVKPITQMVDKKRRRCETEERAGALGSRALNGVNTAVGCPCFIDSETSQDDTTLIFGFPDMEKTIDRGEISTLTTIAINMKCFVGFFQVGRTCAMIKNVRTLLMTCLLHDT